MIALRLDRIRKRFIAPDGGAISAIDDLSVDIAGGSFVVIVGPNASGKSTFLNLVAGRERPDIGTITAKLDGYEQDWTNTCATDRSQYIARVHQDPTAGTADDLTVIEHLRLVQLPRAATPFGAAVATEFHRSTKLRLGNTTLATKLGAMVSELSYGQRQLLALEMAAARSAKILLLDEPTASLDRANTAFCMRRVEELRNELRATVLLVTHDMAVAAQFGERLLVLRDGKLRSDLSGAEKAPLKAADIFHLCGFDAPALVKTPDGLDHTQAGVVGGG